MRTIIIQIILVFSITQLFSQTVYTGFSVPYDPCDPCSGTNISYGTTAYFSQPNQVENTIIHTDSLPSDSRYEKVYEVSGCGKFKLEEFRSKTILDIYNRSNQDWFFQCLINSAEAKDTVAQALLLEICDIVGDQVQHFDYKNSRKILRFLDETIFLSQKSN